MRSRVDARDAYNDGPERGMPDGHGQGAASGVSMGTDLHATAEEATVAEDNGGGGEGHPLAGKGR